MRSPRPAETIQRVFVAAFVMLAGLAAAAAPVAAAHPRYKVPFKCPPKNEGVIDADAQAVVYRASPVVYDAEEHKFVEKPEEIFGCAYGTGRSYHFGSPPYGGKGGSGGVYSVVLAGPIVAYSDVEYAPLRPPNGYNSNEILVRNLRTGRLIHRMPNDSPSSSGAAGQGTTMAIVVDKHGAVAWTTYWVETGPLAQQVCRTSPGASECFPEPGPMYEWEKVYTAVHVADKLGTRIVAASANIGPRSLTLAGSTLYWLQGGKPMSATLD
jgi:hypothetical protein